MFRKVLAKMKESFISILPITIIVLILSLSIAPISAYNIWQFVICAILLVFGMGLFTMGADSAMMKMGGYIGSHLSKSRKISLIVFLSFMIGFIVTFAEPDLTVLASQVPGLNKWVLILTISLGVGIFLVLASLRIIFRLRVSTLLTISYICILCFIPFVPSSFVPLCFDASGVTTGPISVPFIMAFGLGFSSVRAGKDAQDDGFGLVALASVGPIIAVMILSMVLGGGQAEVSLAVAHVSSFSEIFVALGQTIWSTLLEVAVVLAPIVIFFLVYNFIFLKLPKVQLIRLAIGVVYTFVGITIFLSGVNVGFLPMGILLGQSLAGGEFLYMLIPLGLILGACIVMAEPAVHVLNKQVESLTGGKISKKTMFVSLALGVAIAVFLSIVRNIFGIGLLWFLFPMYAICIVLCFVTPNLFTAIAFDSGGVSTGAMATTFIIPFLHGVCVTLGNDIMAYGFGTVSLIACVPILVVQIVGVIYKFELKRANKNAKAISHDVTIIDFEEEI